MQSLLKPTSENLQNPKPYVILQAALVTITGFSLYGFTVGFWRSPLMSFYVAMKMPLLIALTLGCNGLLNGLLGLLLGSGLGFKQSLYSLLSAFAISALILGSVAPVTFFLAINVPTAESAQAETSHAAYLLIHVLLISFAGLIGLMRLWKLLVEHSPSRQVAAVTLGSWLVGNAFVGGQFSWVLRPFFGSPGLEVSFLRENPMKGSFYEAVWRSLQRITEGFPFVNFIMLSALGAVITYLFLQLRNSKKKQHHENKPTY